MEIPTVSDRYSTTEAQEYYDAGCWSTETFGDLLTRQAEAWGDKTFITDGTVSYTYAQLRDRSAQLAVGLRGRGLQAGDRVLVQLPNWAEFVVVAAAVARLGAIMVPVMPIYRQNEVGHVLDDAQVSVVVTASTFKGFDFLAMYRDLAGTRAAVHTIVAVRGAVAPDAVVVPLEAVVADVDPAAAAEEIGSPSPITHTTGLVTGVLIPLITGGSTHVMAEWEPRNGLREIARYGCTVSVTATTFIQMVLDVFDPAEHDASSMRVWVSAGAPIPRSVVERARALLPGACRDYRRRLTVPTPCCGGQQVSRCSAAASRSGIPRAALRHSPRH